MTNENRVLTLIDLIELSHYMLRSAKKRYPEEWESCCITSRDRGDLSLADAMLSLEVYLSSNAGEQE